jgi:hypothetical protein
VRLYVLHFRANLGPKKGDLSPFAVMCEINGSGMREASSERVMAALDAVSRMPFSLPWKKDKALDIAHEGEPLGECVQGDEN